MDDSVIETLPDIEVGGGIYAAGSRLRELPRRLVTGSDIVISRTSITTVFPGTQVGGSFIAEGAGLTDLPDGFSAGENIILSRTKMKSLPRGIRAKNLDISHTEISFIPDDAQIDGLIANNSRLRFVRSMRIQRNLDISDTPCAYLENDIYVGGKATFSGSKIDRIPESFFVKQAIDLRRTTLSGIPSQTPDDCVVFLDTGTKLASAVKKYGFT
jgi:hypothetical protein